MIRYYRNTKLGLYGKKLNYFQIYISGDCFEISIFHYACRRWVLFKNFRSSTDLYNYLEALKFEKSSLKEFKNSFMLMELEK